MQFFEKLEASCLTFHVDLAARWPQRCGKGCVPQGSGPVGARALAVSAARTRVCLLVQRTPLRSFGENQAHLEISRQL